MYPIRRMFKYMEQGELDLNIMSFKADRAGKVDYGKEIVFENNYSVWTRSSLTKKIRVINDLDDLSIAQLVGLRPSDSFKAWFENRLKNPGNKENLVLNDPDQIVKMLASERVDMTVASSPEIRWRSAHLGLRSKVKDSGLIVKKQAYFFVISKASPVYKQNPDLLSRLDQCVKNKKRDGSWASLKLKYQL